MASLPEHLASAPVGREPLPREVMAAHQRQRVIEAATGVFAKRGYTATTVDHIVAAAKVGVGSFYALFAGKEDCFLAAYESALSDAGEQIAARVPPDAPQPERVCAALRALLSLLAAEPLRARLVLVEAQTAGTEARARYDATLERLAPELRLLREANPAAAELPGTLETAILGGAAWFLQQRLVLGEIGDGVGLLPELAEIVLEPYLGHSATAQLLAATA